MGTDSTKWDERITSLEELVMHMQREFESLNSEMIRQGKELATLKNEMLKLKQKQETLSDAIAEERDLLDEKPPHY